MGQAVNWLLTIMILAMALHISRGEPQAPPINLVPL